jgi:NADPH:quinone reductase-like Zn-dependent oxidoreductase
MRQETTKAWVIYADPARGEGLCEIDLDIPGLGPTDVLVEPLFGCWEANMTHAIERSPINVAALRREESIVLGNSGVVRVLRPGPAAHELREGDVCLFCAIGKTDPFGYIKLAHGYDAPGTVGLLARRLGVPAHTLARISPQSRFSPEQWAAFSVRYATAWSNWKVAIGAFRLQVREDELPAPYVWGWGGGTTLATLELAQRAGCDATMLSASPARLAEIAASGIHALDRTAFPDLDFDAERASSDSAYLRRYRKSEQALLREVRERTNNLGVSIFVDHIGAPVYRASLRALGRQGVITTAGWKLGMDLPVKRGTECIARHIHVFTHGARKPEVYESMRYAEETGWMARPGPVYEWDHVPALAADYASGKIESYFPLYRVNN